jgi:hypothetical protein
MSKRVYALLREKNKIEKKRDEILDNLLLEIVNWNSWDHSKRINLYNNYIKPSEELRIIRQQLELELAHELSDRGDIWVKEEEKNNPFNKKW